MAVNGAAAPFTAVALSAETEAVPMLSTSKVAATSEAAARPRVFSIASEALTAAMATGCSREAVVGGRRGAPMVMRMPSTTLPLLTVCVLPSDSRVSV